MKLKKLIALALTLCICASMMVPMASAAKYQGNTMKLGVTTIAEQQADLNNWDVSYAATMTMESSDAKALAVYLADKDQQYCLMYAAAAALQKDGNGNSDSDFEKKQIQNRRQTGSGGQTVTEKSTKDHEGGSGVNTQLEKTENVSLHKTENNLNGKNLIRVDTVVFDGTEYLEHIVTKHYGEHDMVYRVLEFNRKAGQLKDYRHIPKGTKILMPHYE